MLPALLGLGAGIGGGVLSGIFGNAGAKKQLQLMRDALNYQKSLDSRTYGDLAQYRNFGGQQLQGLQAFLANKNPANFTDPGYAFRLKSGTNAIANNAGASGLLQSGDTLRALAQYGQDMGSQEYNNAFNRWLGEGQFRQGLAGIGQQAVVQGGSLANQGAANVGQISANTDAAAPDRAWGDMAGTFGGFGLNQFASGGGFKNFSNIFK